MAETESESPDSITQSDARDPVEALSRRTHKFLLVGLAVFIPLQIALAVFQSSEGVVTRTMQFAVVALLVVSFLSNSWRARQHVWENSPGVRVLLHPATQVVYVLLGSVGVAGIGWHVWNTTYAALASLLFLAVIAAFTVFVMWR